jgi:hypothetical protein
LELGDLPAGRLSIIARVFERRNDWDDAQRHYEAALQQLEDGPRNPCRRRIIAAI